MAGETLITVVGNLTGDPELSMTNSGVARVSFTVASTPRTFDKQAGAWKDGDTLFLRCTAWREYAENVAQSLTKGARVIVQGNLTQRSYESKGEKRTSIDLEVVEVGPALRTATAVVTRAQKNQGGGFGGGGAPQQQWAQPQQPQGQWPAGQQAQFAGFDEQPF